MIKLIIITLIQLLGFENKTQTQAKNSLYPNQKQKQNQKLNWNYNVQTLTIIAIFIIGIITFTIILFLLTGTSTVESGNYYYGINQII